ncbi:MAG: GNAT family N-acetyltransferase [Tolypothrix carrinoi HA7290-LM1]|nr:GNAT family N-acetyltransferase [Tolypothrix carrinoi HA7290-LM1]
MRIEIEDLTNPDVHALLREHLADMREHSPLGCVHALNLDGLKAKSVTFWTVRESSELMGCGALKELDSRSGEIKSMRTAKAHLRKGVATKLLDRILDEAKRRRYERVNLETGSGDAFEPARLLYERFGFTRCEPFADYEDNSFSVFMTIGL